jgi:uncharacterized phiE125 gp8 family phage protein
MEYEVSPVTVVTAPTLQPLTLTQCKKQCEIATDDDTHDDQLTDMIDEATDQWQADTDMCLMTQTLRVYLENWADPIRLPRRPVKSITSVKYYDASNSLTTLATSVYSLDTARREIRLAYDQVWPSITNRWDAIEVTYVAGESDAVNIPATARRALLLLVGYYFGKNRGDNDGIRDNQAYESLVRKYMRGSYP